MTAALGFMSRLSSSQTTNNLREKSPCPGSSLPVALIIGSQALFTAGDLLARANMRQSGFTLATFLTWWFVIYFTLRTVAMFGQLYILANVPIGKSMALFAPLPSHW